MASEMERLDKYRSRVQTPSGPASYIDTGGPGRPVLLVHGVGSSSYLWRNVIAELDGERRCVAFDLPLHGHTPAAPSPYPTPRPITPATVSHSTFPHAVRSPLSTPPAISPRIMVASVGMKFSTW